MATEKQKEYQKEKTRECFTQLGELIASGNLPSVMKECFTEARHMGDYSFTNQLLIHLNSPSFSAVEAMGYKQWERLGRRVRKGEMAIRILAPSQVKVPKYHIDAITDERVQLMDNDGNPIYDRILRFKTVPVFEYRQTDPIPEFVGEVWELKDYEPSPDKLPDVVEVARAMGMIVKYEAAPRKGVYGSCDHTGKAIALHTFDVGTMLHELAHAVDGRIKGGLKGGQHPDQECVAEIASAVLLMLLYGEDKVTDAAAYVQHYEPREKELLKFLNRTYKVVRGILDLTEHYRQHKTLDGVIDDIINKAKAVTATAEGEA